MQTQTIMKIYSMTKESNDFPLLENNMGFTGAYKWFQNGTYYFRLLMFAIDLILGVGLLFGCSVVKELLRNLSLVFMDCIYAQS